MGRAPKVICAIAALALIAVGSCVLHATGTFGLTLEEFSLKSYLIYLGASSLVIGRLWWFWWLTKEAFAPFYDEIFLFPLRCQRGAHTSNGSPVRSNNDGSSFSGLFTRVEMGHIVMGSEG